MFQRPVSDRPEDRTEVGFEVPQHDDRSACAGLDGDPVAGQEAEMGLIFPHHEDERLHGPAFPEHLPKPS